MPSQFWHFGSVIIDGIIDVNKENVNLSLNSYLYNIDLLLEKHAPLKQLNKQLLMISVIIDEIIVSNHW